MGFGRSCLEGLVTPRTQAGPDSHRTRSELSAACRSCGAALTETFADLGSSPLANSFLTRAQLDDAEPFYPLRVLVCDRCFLVQSPPVVTPDEIFGDYAYFSSFSDSFVEHGREYADKMIDQLKLGASSKVVEVASNDGYLLKSFARRGIPLLGIEPARNVAATAQEAGIPTRVDFFTNELAETLREEGQEADLIVANNVLAHVPDLNGFTRGLQTLLKPDGVVTVEFPHLLRLIEQSAFDTIYHEHLFYFSLLSVERPLQRAGLTVFDVEEVATHGGSLRVYACRADASRQREARVEAWRDEECEFGLDRLETYKSFDDRVRQSKRDLLDFLITAKREGKTIVGYGAAAKANTLLNFCGIRGDFLDYVADRSPHKQGRFLPGTHLAVKPPQEVFRTKPDYLLVFAWNLANEVISQMSEVREFGCRFVLPIPKPTVLD